MEISETMAPLVMLLILLETPLRVGLKEHNLEGEI
jgi:hypothetical protein